MQENEQQDDIITSENNDEQEEDTSQEETSEESSEETSQEEEKPKETPEQKRARLQRQLKRVNKELGIEEKKEKEVQAGNYSLHDIRALNKVHDDDVERVEKFAKAEGVSISEAMKSDDLQAILRDREEKRKSAEASNTGGGRRTTSSTSPSKLLEDAQRGKYPDDDEGINKLVNAEMSAKKASLKRD